MALLSAVCSQYISMTSRDMGEVKPAGELFSLDYECPPLIAHRRRETWAVENILRIKPVRRNA